MANRKKTQDTMHKNEKEVYREEDQLGDMLLFKHILITQGEYDTYNNKNVWDMTCSEVIETQNDSGDGSSVHDNESLPDGVRLKRKRKMEVEKCEQATPPKQNVRCNSPTLSQMLDGVYSDESDSEKEPIGERVHLLEFDPPSPDSIFMSQIE